MDPRDAAAALEETIGRYNDAWNAQDVDAILTFHAPGMVFENHTAGDRVEGDAVGPHIAGIFERNPDLRFTGRRLYARDGLVVSEWTATATNQRRAACRVGRNRRLPLRERPDPAQGRLLVVARSARPRRLAVSRPTVHEAAGVPAEIARELAASFELVDSPNRASGVVTTPAIPVDAAFLDAAGPQLRIVANYAVGLDNIDFAAIRERGIVVSNTPGVLTNATAEHAIGLALALLRRIVEGDRSPPAPRRLGVGAGLHGRRGARGQGTARRRPGANRPPSRRARGRARRSDHLRRSRRRPAPSSRRGGCRDPALSADARDAASHRRRRPRRDEAHCRARQHRARAGRRRARARRRHSSGERSRAPRSTCSSTSPP